MGPGSVAVIVVTIIMLGLSPRVSAQTVGDVFRAVNVSVVVIRAKGRDVAAEGGAVRFSEIGSGVLISTDGKIMTAAHVVHAMDDIAVEFAAGESVRARVIASEPAADLSLIKLDHVPAGAVVARMADSDTVRIGDQVVIIGAPYGLARSMTVGWISARWGPNTVYKEMPLAEFFQTDAGINQGNSGGPMFNMRGEVVGIVSHNISRSGGSEGLGFVVTMNTAKKLLLEERSVWSGLEGRFLTSELADIFNLPPRALGYLVKTVAAGSLGEAIGLRGGGKVATIDGDKIVVGGDIILSVQGIAVNNFASYEQIRRALSGLPAGASVTVTVLRAGQVLDLHGRLPQP
jgi:S1-C subfamily serine protease